MLQEVNGASALFNQLAADHEKLKADLAAYAAELAPQLAQRELERQERVNRLQADLDVARELAKLRRPHAERERQERIATARAALSEYENQSLAKLSEWEARQSTQTRWQVIEPNQISATHRARFERQADGSIFVDGENAKGTYQVAANVPLERVTGIRLEALPDERLGGRGPGRNSDGNFVVSELAVRTMPTAGPARLLRSWDFHGPADDWQIEEGAKVVAESGTRHIFGVGKPVGITASFKEPAGEYLVDIVTGIRSATSLKLQWSTAQQPTFDDARSERRTLSAGDGGSIGTPIFVKVDSELTGLRILAEQDQTVLPVDAVRLLAAEAGSQTLLKLQNAQADLSQDGYPAQSAIDGVSDRGSGNGWTIGSQFGKRHLATFELVAPFEASKGRPVEVLIYHNFDSGQHSLGRFRISLTDAAPPINFGLPPEIAAILAKPAAERSDAETSALAAHARQEDAEYNKLAAELAAHEQPFPDDPRVKQLEAELVTAQQPLPADNKLQQLSRAVALSEQQLKDQRLTVAQDIAWALINNPAFLYNH